MRRRKLLVALAGLVVVVAAGAVGLRRRADRVTRANYDRILTGMSRADVETILGPPGDYATVPFDNGSGTKLDPSDVYSEVVRSFSTGDARNRDRACWCGNDRVIVIAFDGPNGRVVGCSFMQPRRLNQSPLDNLLWRLKRQWHRWFPE
jgi:hypothetical protein